MWTAKNKFWVYCWQSSFVFNLPVVGTWHIGVGLLDSWMDESDCFDFGLDSIADCLTYNQNHGQMSNTHKCIKHIRLIYFNIQFYSKSTQTIHILLTCAAEKSVWITFSSDSLWFISVVSVLINVWYSVILLSFGKIYIYIFIIYEILRK